MFRKMYRRYKRFARKNRKPLLRANKYALKGVWRAINTLKLGMNVEKKFHDKLSLITSTATATSPLLLATPWDGLDQGSATNQRIGDQVKALWTTFKVTVDWAPVGLNPAATAFVRFLVVLDTEPRATNAASAAQIRDGILQATATGPLQITSPYKVLHTGTGGIVGQRYKIMKDFVVSFDNVKIKQRVVTINLNHTRNKYKGMRIKYDESGSDYPADDRLYIIALTDSTVADDLQFSGDYSRMCFVDN